MAGVERSLDGTVAASLTKTTAMELAAANVRVNCICLGDIATNIFGRELDALTELQPIAPSGRPRDIVEATLRPASDASSFVTGHALVVDGGLTIGQPRRLREPIATIPTTAAGE